MTNADSVRPTPQRIQSIDALRGFDMFWIAGGTPLLLSFVKIFVNPPPAWLSSQFEHKLWNGFSAEDLIMPLFLFVVGAAMPFSFTRRREEGQTRRSMYLKVLRRVIILWILGMIMQGRLLEYDINRLYLFSNTLQAIAVGYAIAAILLLNLSIRRQAASIIVLLVGYYLLMRWMPFPGAGADRFDRDANLALWVDQQILGRFRNASRYVWILPGMGFAATVLMGVMGGHLLRARLGNWQKVGALAGIGTGALAAALIWDRWFPINKHLWSSSMALWAGGLSYLLLMLFYMVIDVLGWRRWAFPFTVIGANAITAYMIGKFISFDSTSQVLVGKLTPHLGSAGEFVQKLVAVSVMWLFLWYLYRNRTFIRI